MKMPVDIGHGDVLIAAITSCTNTSNPSVMLAAGIVAKKAVEKGLQVRPEVKDLAGRRGHGWSRATWKRPAFSPTWTSSASPPWVTAAPPASATRAPLEPHVEQLVNKHDLIAASVLSGNRNFEARVHQSIKANFLMSPPLVVAFAIAGRVGTSTWTRIPSASAATASLSTSGTSGRRGGDERGPGSGCGHQAVPAELRRRSLARDPRVGGDHRALGPGVPVGPEEHVHPGAALFRRLRAASRPADRQSGRRGRWRSSGTP